MGFTPIDYIKWKSKGRLLDWFGVRDGKMTVVMGDLKTKLERLMMKQAL